MKANRFCSVVTNSGLPVLVPILVPSGGSRAAQRLLPLQYRSISSSRCLLAPAAAAAQPQAKDSSTGRDEKASPAKPTSARPFGAPLYLRRPDRRNVINQQQREILASLHQARNPQSSASLIRNRYSSPTEQAQTQIASQVGDILSRDDVHLRIAAPPPPRRDAYMGRAISVNKQAGMDFGRALAALQRTMKVNDIRGQFHKQKFHERNGLKRKRLKRERWRKRFMGGFRAMIAKVKRMKTQGW